MIATIIFLIALVVTIILLFAGFRVVNKSLKEGGTSTKIPKQILIKGTLLVLASVVSLWIAYCALHFKEYLDGVCTLSELATTYLFDVLKKYGWVVVLPWLLSYMRFSTRSNSNDTDKM